MKNSASRKAEAYITPPTNEDNRHQRDPNRSVIGDRAFRGKRFGLFFPDWASFGRVDEFSMREKSATLYCASSAIRGRTLSYLLRQ